MKWGKRAKTQLLLSLTLIVVSVHLHGKDRSTAQINRMSMNKVAPKLFPVPAGAPPKSEKSVLVAVKPLYVPDDGYWSKEIARKEEQRYNKIVFEAMSADPLFRVVDPSEMAGRDGLDDEFRNGRLGSIRNELQADIVVLLHAGRKDESGRRVNEKGHKVVHIGSRFYFSYDVSSTANYQPLSGRVLAEEGKSLTDDYKDALASKLAEDLRNTVREKIHPEIMRGDQRTAASKDLAEWSDNTEFRSISDGDKKDGEVAAPKKKWGFTTTTPEGAVSPKEFFKKKKEPAE